MDIITALYPLLTDLIIAVGTILLGYLTLFVKQHYSVKQVETAKKVAGIAVGFADEVAHVSGINGPEKLDAAMFQAKVLANKIGIKLTNEQWNGLIKAVVNEGRTIYDSVQGQAPVEVAPGVLPEATIPPLEPVAPVVEAITPIMPIVSLNPLLQPVFDSAIVAYNQVLTDSAQVLATQTK